MEKKPESNLRWWVLFTVIIGTFLGRLDQTVVNLAMPKMIDAFSITITAAGWIATAYILANAVFVPIWGKLGDTIGRKKVYILGFSIFIFGSALAGLAWNLTSMIVFRIIQAVAASADYPTAMAILAVTFSEGKERAQALGIWSSSFAAAAVFGPLVGGPLIDNFGWRSIFLVNIPVGIAGIFMAMRFIKESKAKVAATYFDWWGAMALGGFLSALVLVLDQGLSWGWLSVPSLICYFFIVALFAAFIRIEHKVKEPIVDLKFFKIPPFVNALLNSFIVFMAMMGAMFLLPIFAQTFLGYTATQTGYLFIPMALTMVVMAYLGGTLAGKVESRFVIFAGTIVAGIGMFMFVGLDPRSTALDVMIPLSVMAAGLGFGMAQRTNIVASVVNPDEIGVASSVLALVRNVAGAFGIAIFGTILSNATYGNIFSISRYSHLFSAGASAVKKFAALVELKAQVSAYSNVFFVAAVVIIIGAIPVLFLKIKNERTDIKVQVE